MKKELRKVVIQKRKNILEKEKFDKQIKDNLLKNKYVKNSKNILIYVSKKDEVDTYSLITKLLELKKNVYAPRIENEIMNFYRISSLKELKLGNFSIYEPTSKELFLNDSDSCIIVPGLLFDKNMNRLGYGKGYYDKYLSTMDIHKIGICYSEFLVDKIIAYDYDEKMNEIITEKSYGI